MVVILRNGRRKKGDFQEKITPVACIMYIIYCINWLVKAQHYVMFLSSIIFTDFCFFFFFFRKQIIYNIYKYKVVISVCLFDHNSGTPDFDWGTL